MSSRQQAVQRFYADLGMTANPVMSQDGNSLITTTTITAQIDQFQAYDVIAQVRDKRTPFGFYANHNIQSSPGYDAVSITFQDINLGVDGTVSRYNAATRSINRPLEEHVDSDGNRDYKAIWNHHLVGPAGTTITNTEYDLWAAVGIANDKVDISPPSGGSSGVSFIKSNQALPQGKAIVKVSGHASVSSGTATKAGVQSTLVPSDIVFETLYTRKVAILNSSADLVGKLLAPGQEFGKTGTTNENWLVTDVKSEKINDWYQINIEYLFAKRGWDTDLYSVYS